MHIIDICGKIGLGDHLKTLSCILSRHTEDLFLRIHVDPKSIINHEYIYKILLQEFCIPNYQKIKYTVLYDWYTYDYSEACNKFKNKYAYYDWYFTGNIDFVMHKHTNYTPFKKQHINRNNTRILLSLNHSGMPTNPNDKLYPKFFPHHINKLLASFHMKNDCYCLGFEYNELDVEINLMQTCRYAIGIEGAWTHIAHCMKVPYISFFNSAFDVKALHPEHPTLKLINTYEIFNYLR